MNYLPPEEVLELIIIKAQAVEQAAKAAHRAGFTLTTAEELAHAIGDLEGARQMLKWSYESLVSYSWSASTLYDRYMISRNPRET